MNEEMKKSIEQEAEELYPDKKLYGTQKLGPPPVFNAIQKARRQGYIAAATKYSEQQRQVIADTWDDGFKFGNAYGGGLLSVKKISEMKQNWLNNLFPSEIKGEQQTK